MVVVVGDGWTTGTLCRETARINYGHAIATIVLLVLVWHRATMLGGCWSTALYLAHYRVGFGGAQAIDTTSVISRTGSQHAIFETKIQFGQGVIYRFFFLSVLPLGLVQYFDKKKNCSTAGHVYVLEYTHVYT